MQKNQEAEERKDTTRKKEREEDMERYIYFRDMDIARAKEVLESQKAWKKILEKEREEREKITQALRNSTKYLLFPFYQYSFKNFQGYWIGLESTLL